MSRREAWFSHLSNALVGGTGLVYGWMVYFAESDDPFALVNHPLQPSLQSWHILTAPLLVFACALFWSNHVWKRVQNGFSTRRRSGLALFALFFPMVFSGYLLQTSESEGWRRAWIVLHVASSVGWILLYAWHQLSARSRVSSVSIGGSSGP